MEKKIKNKFKFTISFPRCPRCRERAEEGDLDLVFEMLRHKIINRTGKRIPVTITISKI